MPIYKKYHSGVAIDGAKSDFPLYNLKLKKTAQIERFYPDEWLIVNSLRHYLKLRGINAVQVLAEDWAGNGYPGRGNTNKGRSGGEEDGTDEGYSNTPGFNEAILNTVDACKQDSLILIPYLYAFHHPGISLLVKKSLNAGTAIYSDPMGFPPGKKEVLDLEEQLKSHNNFDVQYVKTAQQTGGSICGFVLTGTMIKFIEEYLANGNITVKGFKSPRPAMNTAYLFQMYINNWNFDDDVKPLVDEVMLAEKDLWNDFIDEQKIEPADKIKALLKDALEAQDMFLNEVVPRGTDRRPLNTLKLNFIRDFQQKLIEVMFLKREDLELSVNLLVGLSAVLLQATSVGMFNAVYNASRECMKLENLMSPGLFEKTRLVLGIEIPAKGHRFGFFKAALAAMRGVAGHQEERKPTLR